VIIGGAVMKVASRSLSVVIRVTMTPSPL